MYLLTALLFFSAPLVLEEEIEEIDDQVVVLDDLEGRDCLGIVTEEEIDAICDSFLVEDEE